MKKKWDALVVGARRAAVAVRAEVGAGKALLLVALALLGYGVAGWSRYAAAVAVALVLLWVALPARHGFIVRPPETDKRKRREP